MTEVTDALKSAGPKLVPFLKTVAIYFVIYIPFGQPSFTAAALKCLPIISLMIFVVLYTRTLEERHRWFGRKILLGLAFSCVGDACLVWSHSQTFFQLGMLAFGIGHTFYIQAFGFKPLNMKLGLGLYLTSMGSVVYMMPGLNGILVYAVPSYSIAITTMFWRAASRLNKREPFSWSKLFTVLGAFSFLLSDTILAFDRFKSPVPHSQALIMTTYYAAQFGIALSVVDPRDSSKIRKA